MRTNALRRMLIERIQSLGIRSDKPHSKGTLMAELFAILVATIAAATAAAATRTPAPIPVKVKSRR